MTKIYVFKNKKEIKLLKSNNKFYGKLLGIIETKLNFNTYVQLVEEYGNTPAIELLINI